MTVRGSGASILGGAWARLCGELPHGVGAGWEGPCVWVMSLDSTGKGPGAQSSGGRRAQGFSIFRGGRLLGGVCAQSR